MSHHITTHPKGILAEVAGMAEICGSGSLTFAAVRLHIQNSKNTVTAPSASHAVKNNRRRCISITCFLRNLEEEYRGRVSSPLRDCKNPVNWGLAAFHGLAGRRAMCDSFGHSKVTELPYLPAFSPLYMFCTSPLRYYTTCATSAECRVNKLQKNHQGLYCWRYVTRASASHRKPVPLLHNDCGGAFRWRYGSIICPVC